MRFLEKPSWGQVFSDTINTGVYVLEPEVLRAVPAGEPYDFSKQLFPDLLERGKPIYGQVMEGYWQDIGNLEQYRQANFDAIDHRRTGAPGHPPARQRLLGEGVQLADLSQIQGPAYIGNYCRIEEGARVGPYSLLGNNVVVKEGVTVGRSVIDSGTYIGHGARIEGAILGKRVRRPRARRAQPRRGGRRRVLDRRRVGAGAGRQGVPVQDDRAGRDDPLEPDLGVARHHHAVRPGRRQRPGQRRHHARRRGAAGDGLRHDAAGGARITASRDATRPRG